MTIEHTDATHLELALFVIMIVCAIVSDMLTLSQRQTLRTISRFCFFMFFMCFFGVVAVGLTEIIG